MSIYNDVFKRSAFSNILLYTLIMGLKNHNTNRGKNRTQDAESDSKGRDLRTVDDIENGFHILARMLADYHLRHKGSCKPISSDKNPDNTPH